MLFRGRRLKRGSLSLYRAPCAAAVGRVAFIAAGGFRSAVMRNRVRRRLREVFRTHRAAFPQNQDLILRGDAGSAALEFAEFRSEILNLAAAAQRGQSLTTEGTVPAEKRDSPGQDAVENP